MNKYIEEELQGRKIEEVDVLILDDCECTEVSGLTDEFVNLEKLSLVSCGLETLKGFPNLPNLKKLDLSNNKIPISDLALLIGCQGLTHLALRESDIKDVSSLEPLKKLKNLRKLELEGCDVAESETFREKVFELLDQIVFLDRFDRDNQEDENDSNLDDDDEDDDEVEDDENEDGHDDEDSDGGEEGDDDDGEDYGQDDEDGGHARGTKRKHQDEEDV